MKTTNALTAIQEIFSFAFRDPQWKKKFLIGAGIAFAGTAVPVLPWLVILGYGARVARQAVAESIASRGAADPDLERHASDATSEGNSRDPRVLTAAPIGTLPEWDNWNDFLVDGLRQFGVSLVVSFPLAALATLFFGLYFLVQLFLVIQANNINPGAIALIGIFGAGVLYFAAAVTMVVVPLTYLVLPAAAVRVAVTRRFSDLFRADWLDNLRSNLGGYLALLFFFCGLYVVLVLAVQVIYFSVVLCCLLPVVFSLAGFYFVLLFYHGGGLAYAGGTEG